MNSNNQLSLNKEDIHNFNTALNIYENNYSHEYLIELLKNGNIAQRQAAALSLDCIKNIDDAEVLMSNLTGCDGKVRESVSFRLKEFVPQNPQLFQDFPKIFAEAVIDINGNICRNTISAITSLKNNKQFCDNFCQIIINNTQKIIQKVKTFDIQDGKYKINKEVFKLYWYLETIYEFHNSIENKILEDILSQCAQIGDYTIREKTAKILSTLSEQESFKKLKTILKNDPNYYVARY